MTRSKLINREYILILDFGSQYTQLIGRRVRELSVYSEIVPYHAALERMAQSRPAGLILSGGPDSVCREGSPGVSPAWQLRKQLFSIERAQVPENRVLFWHSTSIRHPFS